MELFEHTTTMSGVSLPAAYYETPLHCTGASFMSVWLPLRQRTPPLGVYRDRIAMAKKFRVMASLVTAGGLPGWFPTCCLCPTHVFELPTASPALGPMSSELVHNELRGLIVLAHGHSDGPLVLAHVCERLAASGFVVAAPCFSDSHANEDPAVVQNGRAFLPEQTILRAHAMDACIALLRETYPGLANRPTALLGYSMGSDTIRQMQLDCPRVYIGGPGWVQSVTGADRMVAETSAPAGPSLQLLASPDGLMDLYQLTADKSSMLTGYAHPGERSRVTVADFDGVMKRVGGPPKHLRVDFEPFGHGDFKYPPFEKVEIQAWRSGFCGVNPWSPCGRDIDDATVEQRATLGGTVIIRWLLAAMPAATSS